ncbi:MAG: NAD-dependent epimerase/dehydratase family protein [Polyangiales bacterium]
MLDRRDLDEILAAPVDWDELRGAHVLVTGGTGFVGIWLIEALCHADVRLGLGLRLSVLARTAARLHERVPHLVDRVELVACDVREMPQFDATHVIHAATSTSQTTRPRDLVSTIVDGTRRVLDATKAARRFLFTSSGAVYGPQAAGVLVREEEPGAVDTLDPRQAYAESKRLAELSCAIEVAEGRAATIARCFAFVGPWLPLDEHFAIGNFLADVLAKRPVVVRGDGTPIRSYLYASDLAAWLLALLTRGAPGRAYNVGSDRAFSLGEIAARIAAANGLSCRIEGGPPRTGVSVYAPSTARIRSELGVTESVDLDEAVARTLAWHRTSA